MAFNILFEVGIFKYVLINPSRYSLCETLLIELATALSIDRVQSTIKFDSKIVIVVNRFKLNTIDKLRIICNTG